MSKKLFKRNGRRKTRVATTIQNKYSKRYLKK